MFILTIISRISFQMSANGFKNLSEKQRQMKFFGFQGQKVLPRGRIWGSPNLMRKPEVFQDSHVRRGILSTCGSQRDSE